MFWPISSREPNCDCRSDQSFRVFLVCPTDLFLYYSGSILLVFPLLLLLVIIFIVRGICAFLIFELFYISADSVWLKLISDAFFYRPIEYLNFFICLIS